MGAGAGVDSGGVPGASYPNFAGKHAGEALFAVAEVRGLRLASAFVISDSLAELTWNPSFHDPAVRAGLTGLYQAAVATLMADGES